MNSRYDRDNDLQDLHESDGPDREISLGTATILGIFFALALLCAVFFGFGYSLGRHSAQPVASAVDAAAEPDSSGSKPAPGSALNQGRNSSSAKQTGNGDQTETPQDHSSVDAAEESQQVPAPSRVRTVVSPSSSDSETRAAAYAKASVSKPVAATAPAAATGPGSPVVQVAAVSHQEDATILAAALKQRGYNVSVRQMPQDKLLHVQVGPFASKKEADAMRVRLQADGYNAIVK